MSRTAHDTAIEAIRDVVTRSIGYVPPEKVTVACSMLERALAEFDLAILKATDQRNRLASDALTALARAGVATPEKGYLVEPQCLIGDIAKLARERDQAAEAAAKTEATTPETLLQLINEARVAAADRAKLSEIAAGALHGEARALISLNEQKAQAKKQEGELTGAIKELLARIDYERGQFEPDCWCTSSGNEDPPGSVDMPCAACKARKLVGITKADPT